MGRRYFFLGIVQELVCHYLAGSGSRNVDREKKESKGATFSKQKKISVGFLCIPILAGILHFVLVSFATSLLDNSH